MGKKRKRGTDEAGDAPHAHGRSKAAFKTSAPEAKKQQLSKSGSDQLDIQVVAGSYERVLHGITVRIREDDSGTPKATFADSFLFNAHTSAIRCLALSPPSEGTQKVLLATGGTDERINLYSLSTIPPSSPSQQVGLGHDRADASTPSNREIGTLNHHSATVTCLRFPARTKLLSAAGDNTIAVLRTRDWEVLSSLRAPLPKPQGRPSGDTAPPGDGPAGVNDLAVHPSLKLMITVGRGERCMRLWNLVTGKKAGVLQFGRDLLADVGERGKHAGAGEGRKVAWDGEGEEFAVGFERGAVVFGVDSKARGIARPRRPPTKIHQMRYHVLPGGQEKLLVVSTEDGRLLFYLTSEADLKPHADAGTTNGDDTEEVHVPHCPLVAQLGRSSDAMGRIKDFTILPTPVQQSEPEGLPSQVVVTARSDGAVQIWALDAAAISQSVERSRSSDANDNGDGSEDVPDVGTLLGTCKTNNRITCMEAFVLDGTPDASSEDAQVEDGNGVVDASGSESSISGDSEEVKDA